MQEKVKLALAPTRELQFRHILTVQQLLFFCSVFSESAFFHVNMHTFMARGQNQTTEIKRGPTKNR